MSSKVGGAAGSDGKDAEETTRLVLDAFNAQEKGFTYHRYPDTKSASRGNKMNILAAQPSDYIVGYRYFVPERDFVHRASFHLEVKETVKTSLARKSIRQYPMLKKWWWAGVEPVVLVHQLTENRWYVLRATRLFPGQCEDEFDDSKTPGQFPLEGLFPYQSAEHALRDAFEIRKRRLQ